MNVFVKGFIVRTSDGDEFYFTTQARADHFVDTYPPDMGYAWCAGVQLVDKGDATD